MDRAILVLLVSLVFVWRIDCALKYCRVTIDCVEGKRCCDRICLSRTTCTGLCYSHSDCDKDYGESCRLGKCQCVQPPCNLETRSTAKPCIDDSQCTKNETCKDAVCQTLDSLTKSKSMNAVVLGIVATIGLVIFAGAFYLCLRKQHSSRPSLAAKQAHHRAMERARTSEQSCVQASRDAISKKSVGNSKEKTRKNSGKRHLEAKGFHQKPPITSPSSLIELSAIIEEDEISEVTSK